ncbi:hypothetical protein NG885_07800 [Enterococcus faecium]|uniref:hypothetical protein n=1 Tax=Enterococcus faecium TaxID=1352 RepID=UPI002091B7C5|nr:hypothetical protein [Enterococcus faecium]MCO5531570.1 hypothetical protein [Enterococcus faecium]
MISDDYQDIREFKQYLQIEKRISSCGEGEVEVMVSLIEQNDRLSVPILILTMDSNRFGIEIFWDRVNISDEQVKSMGLWSRYSTGYNYNFRFSDKDKTLTIFDSKKKKLVFK